MHWRRDIVIVMDNSAKTPRGGRAHHSVLAPHVAAIRQWRKERKSWREIAEFLRAEKGIAVTLFAAYRFMRRLATRRPGWEELKHSAEPPAHSKAPTGQPAPISPTTTFKRPNRESFNPNSYL